MNTDPLRELPVVSQDLVPLSRIIERILGKTYNDLAGLVEVLPGLADDERKRSIVEFVIQSRRQIVKLLVLSKWSANSLDIRKCMNLVAFLQAQNQIFSDSITGLQQVKEILANARVRNYDLETALDLLTTGTYRRLPTSIKETFAGIDPLTDDQVIDTLYEVDDILRYRLAVIEHVPSQMRSYTIRDGRVYFQVPNRFKASLTVTGLEKDDAWYLLHLEFLFPPPKGSKQAGLLSKPKGPLRDQILAIGNEILAKAVQAGQEQEDLAVAERPLSKIYTFLDNLTANYEAEAGVFKR